MDWQDFWGIVIFLFFVNASIGFYKERNAGDAVQALGDVLAPKAKSGEMASDTMVGSRFFLVPGDDLSFKLGDIVPGSVNAKRH